MFQKLLLNFTWWVNRKDPDGRNVFAGGFLGLDNIGVFDRSAPLPTGGYLEQADGTAWMAFYCQNMLQIALELALNTIRRMKTSRSSSSSISCGSPMRWITLASDDEMWDEEDGFFYDVLRLPDGQAIRLKVRSTGGAAAAVRLDRLRGDDAASDPGLSELIALVHEAPSRTDGNMRRPEEAWRQ